MIQYQILQTKITRTVWQPLRRIANEILGVTGLTLETSNYSSPGERGGGWIFRGITWCFRGGGGGGGGQSKLAVYKGRD